MGWLERSNGYYRSQILSITGYTASWIISQQSYVFLARLQVKAYYRSTVDNIIFVSYTRKLVYNFTKDFAFRLTPKTFMGCVGDAFHFTMISEVRNLEEQVRRAEGKNRSNNKPYKIIFSISLGNRKEERRERGRIPLPKQGESASHGTWRGYGYA